MIAKIKAFEDIPEKYKCCPARIEQIKQSVGNVNTLNRILEKAHYACDDCGTKINGVGYKNITNEYFYMADIIDIAEGEI